MPGYVLPAAHERATKDSSGALFDTQHPVAHNIVTIDPVTKQEVVQRLTAEGLKELTHKNRSVSGVRDKNTIGYESVAQASAPSMTPERAPGVQLTVKEPLNGTAVGPVIDILPLPSVVTRIPANTPIQERPKDLDLEPDAAPGPKRISSYEVPVRKSDTEPAPEPLIMPTLEGPVSVIPLPPSAPVPGAPPTPLASANTNMNAMKVARVKVRFVSRMGKLAVPYNVVFQDGISLVMVQHSPEGIFYDPPSGTDEHIEVQWHGRMFMCLPGVHFVMPDQQTSFTVFLIDEQATQIKEQQERERKGQYSAAPQGQ